MNDPKKQSKKALARAENFMDEFNLQIPILLAPMPNATPPELAAAIPNKGGMGACGALFLGAKEIRSWVNDMRSQSNGVFQLNTWIPDPEPKRNHKAERRVCEFLSLIHI